MLIDIYLLLGRARNVQGFLQDNSWALVSKPKAFRLLVDVLFQRAISNQGTTEQCGWQYLGTKINSEFA